MRKPQKSDFLELGSFKFKIVKNLNLHLSI
jgi:hypothetical protein